MKKYFLMILFVSVCSSLVFGQTSQDKRRIEEEKRDILDARDLKILIKKDSKLPPPDSSNLDFFSQLLSKKYVLISDALRAMAILQGIEDKILPPKIVSNLNKNEPLRNGLLAYLFCKVMNLKGGIILRFFGLTERYAFKELVYMDIMQSGHINAIVSSEEFILMFTRTADYIASKQKEKIN